MRVYRYAFVSCLLALGAPTMAQITNGGFETAPTTPVTPGDWQYNGGGVRDSVSVHSGQFAADLNNTAQGANVNVQQQTLFGSITPGSTYSLNYWTKASYGVAGEGQLQIAFLNSGGLLLPGYPTFSQIPASASYTLGTKSLTAPAGASAFFVAFNAVTGAVPGASSQLFVDDVSLTVPEPATLAALSLATVALKRRRVG